MLKTLAAGLILSVSISALANVGFRCSDEYATDGSSSIVDLTAGKYVKTTETSYNGPATCLSSEKLANPPMKISQNETSAVLKLQNGKELTFYQYIGEDPTSSQWYLTGDGDKTYEAPQNVCMYYDDAPLSTSRELSACPK